MQSLNQARTSAAATSDWAGTGGLERGCLPEVIGKLDDDDLRTGSRGSLLRGNSIAAFAEDRRDSVASLRSGAIQGQVKPVSAIRVSTRY